VAPCGGDVLGTWTSASCELKISGMANLGTTGLGCTMAPITGSMKVSGSWTAKAGGMFADATTTSGQAVLELAKECKAISGFATTCDRINLQNLGLTNEPERNTSFTCVDKAETEGCTCTAVINQYGGMASISLESAFNDVEGSSGTYTTAENKLVAKTDDVETEYSYCVAGNTLTMNLTTVSMLGTVTGPIVLQKQ
jgi:hypothetical protein